jgi:hypothetical protein
MPHPYLIEPMHALVGMQVCGPADAADQPAAALAARRRTAGVISR